MIEIILDRYNNEFIFITNSDGSTQSMPKSVWDEIKAAEENNG
jgi:hypothetical protein